LKLISQSTGRIDGAEKNIKTMCNENYDGYYEAECHAAAAEAEALQELKYQEYLENLLRAGEGGLYAAHVALDWLHSREFAESGLSAIEFITKKKEKLENPFNHTL